MLDDAHRAQEAREDAARLQAARRRQLATLKGLGFTLAVVIAPFLALLFGLTEALVVLAVALAFTGWLAWSAAGQEAGAALAPRLRAAALLALVLVAVTLAIVVFRVTG